MNDTDLAAAVRQTLERHARNAPAPVDLVETVKAGSRRRGIRRRLAAGISGLAVVGLAVGIPTVVAQPASPEPDAPGEVTVCFDLGRDGIPQRLMVAERRGDELVNSDVGQWRGGNSDDVEHTVEHEGFRVDLTGRDALDSVPISQPAERISVNGREGRIGDESFEDESGDRILGFETGVSAAGVEVVLSVQVLAGSPSDRELVAWAESIEFSTKPADCGF